MKKLLFLLCIQKILCATVNEPFSIGINAGYRKDNLIWRLNETNNKQKFDLKYLQTNIFFKVISRDLYLFSNFGYGFLVNGGIDQELVYKEHGKDLEALLEFGYAVNLTPGRFDKVIIIPIFGYNGFWKFLNYLKQTWYGPYIGGNLEVILHRVIFDLGYHFNWLTLNHKAQEIKDSTSGPYSHSGFVKINWLLSPKVKIAILGKLNYFIADKEKVYFQNQRLKLYSKWWYALGALELNFEF